MTLAKANKKRELNAYFKPEGFLIEITQDNAANSVEGTKEDNFYEISLSYCRYVN